MEAETTQAGSKPGRCLHHPGIARAALCDVCGASLCLACAVPVRGVAVGPECLAKVLDDAEPATPPPAPFVTRTDPVGAVVFGLVILLSALPWSRFGAASGPFLAWTIHWSLLAVGGAVLGLFVAVAPTRRRWSPTLEVGLQLALATLVAAGAFLHYDRPPPLSSPTIVPILAGLAAAIAAAGGVAKARSLLRMRRPRPGPYG
jgi:hypothetical protein